MRIAETVLFAVALVAELLAAGIVVVEIRVAHCERQGAQRARQELPMSRALGLGSGIVNRFAFDELRRHERESYGREVERLFGTIARQRWAFVSFVVGALAGTAAGLLGVWS